MIFIMLSRCQHLKNYKASLDTYLSIFLREIQDCASAAP